MSLFFLNNETRQRLNPIAGDVLMHATATAMLVHVGHQSDEQKTYGFVDLALMRAALPHWSAKRLHATAAVLVRLGAWEVTEGGWQFVGWEAEQRSKASRNADAARQARHRSRKQVRELFAPKTARNGSRKVRFSSDKKTETSGPVLNDNAELREPVTRDVTPLPSVKTLLSSREEGPPSAAAPPAVACIEQERAKRADPPKPAAKRTRRRTARDALLAEIVEAYNAQYSPRHDGLRTLTGFGLLARLVDCYAPDGVFRREFFDRTVRAFLDDPQWSRSYQGRTPRGYGLEAFVWNHERYHRQHQPAQAEWVDYGS